MDYRETKWLIFQGLNLTGPVIACTGGKVTEQSLLMNRTSPLHITDAL